MRIDKWLWAVRLFKTRTMAANNIKSGKVKINGNPAKASANLVGGQEVSIKKGGINFTFKVIRLIEKRVGAPIATTCYEDTTPQAEKDKFKEWFYSDAGIEFREKGTGRPTKKDRREIDTFKDGDIINDWEDFFENEG